MTRLEPPRTLLRLALGLALAASFLPPLRADAPAGRYLLAGDGTVHDMQTELTWQQADDGVDRDHPSAIAYCTSLPLAGGGWRLPAVKELLSILDTSRSNPAIDITAFLGASNTSFWTVSDQAGIPGGKWFVYFVNGNLSWTDTSALNRVRCVR